MEPPSCPPAYASLPSITKTIAGLPLTLFHHPSFPLSSPATNPPHLLILLHPLFRNAEFMSGLARRLLGDYYSSRTDPRQNLVVLTFDQRNHGPRCQDRIANVNWERGNQTYALDLFTTYTGTARDVSEALDVLLPGGYFPALKSAAPFVGGISLGGHASWAVVLSDERVRGAGVVIGCGDYVALMEYRAGLMKWEGKVGAGLEGLLERYDLATMVGRDLEGVRRRLEGKRILALEGKRDVDVPPKCSEGVYKKIKDAGVDLTVRRFEGVAHVMTEEMCGVYSEWWREVWGVGGEERGKI